MGEPMLSNYFDLQGRNRRSGLHNYSLAVFLWILASGLEVLLGSIGFLPSDLLFFGIAPLITMLSGLLPGLLSILLDVFIYMIFLGDSLPKSIGLQTVIHPLPSISSIVFLLESSVLCVFIDRLIKKFHQHQEQQLLELNDYLQRLTVISKVTGISTWEWNFRGSDVDFSDQQVIIYDAITGDYISAHGLVNEKDEVYLKKDIEAAIVGMRELDTIFRIINPLGDVRYIHTIGTVIRDEYGHPVKIFGVHWDCSKDHQKDEALRLLQTAMDRLSDILIISKVEPLTALDLKIVYVNDTFERVTGYSQKEAIGHTPYMLRGSAIGAAERLKIDEALKNWQRVHVQILNYKKNGEAFWSDLDISPIADGKGQFTHWLSVQRDITEHKKMELAFQSSQIKLRGLYEMSPLGIILRNAEGRIMESNPAFNKMLGYTEAELQNISSSSFSVHASESEITNILHSPNRFHVYEGAYLTKNGQRIEVRLYAVKISLNGELCIWTMVENINKQKSIERNLKNSRVFVEQAQAAKPQFIADMSRKIRMPLDEITGLTRSALALEADSEVRNYLTCINESSEALLRAVDDILDGSKIEDGKLKLEMSPFDLRNVLKNIKEVFEFSAAQKGLDLVFTIQPEIPEMLIGDALRIQQVLNNLISNAIKFTEQGQVTLSVAISKPVIGQKNGQTHLVFNVSDTGIGMTVEEQNVWLQAVAPTNATINHRFGGTGLGLFICQQLIKLMGGKLFINSVKSQGSTLGFDIILDVAKPELPKHEITTSLPPSSVQRLDNPAEDLNLEHLLLSLDNDRNLAFELLNTFSSDAISGLKKISHELENNRYANAHKLLHDLKGAAGTLGANNLHTAADILDNQLKQNKFDSALFEEVKRKVQAVNDAIKDAIRREAEPAPTGTAVENATVEPPTKRLDHNNTLSGRRILVAEDNHFAQLAVKELLQLFGATVDIAQHGKQALQFLSEHDYDAILMDMNMPEMDGAEATAHIRSQPQYATLPIIAFSADDSEQERAHCLALGMNDAIPKGANSEQLIQLLCYWIARNTSGASDTSSVPLDLPSLMSPPIPSVTLNNLTGFDLRGVLAMVDGLASADGNDDLILRLLRTFYQDTATTLKDIADCIARNDLDSARKIVHNIKGSSGILGSKKLHDVAEKLNLELKHGKVDDKIYQEFERELLATRATLVQL